MLKSKRLLVWFLSIGLICTSVGVSSKPAPCAPAAGPPKPGTIIDSSNAKLYSAYITPALMKAIGHGLKIRVTPTERVDWSQGYKNATEKYSAQVRLDQHEWLQNYVAGLPFPNIDPADPKVAVKIAYDQAYGPFMMDDNRIVGYREAAYAFKPGKPADFTRDPNYDHWAREVDFLRYLHRSQVDPRPKLGSDPEGIEFAIRTQNWNDPSHTTCFPGADPSQNYQALAVRYLDPTRPDEWFWFVQGAMPPLRQENLSTIVWAGYCQYPYYQPKVEFAHYRLVATLPVLACVDDAGGMGLERESGEFDTVPFQVRRAYVLKSTPIEQLPPSVSRIYIDSETFLELALDGSIYGGGGKDAFYALPLWKRLPAAHGGSIYELAGGFGQPNLKAQLKAADVWRAEHPELFRMKTAAPEGLPHFWWFFADKQEINTGKMSEALFDPYAMR